MFYVLKQKFPHILFRNTLSDVAFGNSSEINRKLIVKQSVVRNQLLTQLRLPNI